MHRHRSEKVGGRRGGWLSGRSSFRVDKKSAKNFNKDINHGEDASPVADDRTTAKNNNSSSKLSEDTSVTEPVSTGGSSSKQSSKPAIYKTGIIADFDLPNWETPDRVASGDSINTDVLPQTDKQRQQRPPPTPPPPPPHHNQQRERSHQQHRGSPQKDNLENMVVHCSDSISSIGDDATYLTMEDSCSSEASPIRRGGKGGLSSKNYRENRSGRGAYGHHQRPYGDQGSSYRHQHNQSQAPYHDSRMAAKPPPSPYSQRPRYDNRDPYQHHQSPPRQPFYSPENDRSHPPRGHSREYHSSYNRSTPDPYALSPSPYISRQPPPPPPPPPRPPPSPRRGQYSSSPYQDDDASSYSRPGPPRHQTGQMLDEGGPLDSSYGGGRHDQRHYPQHEEHIPSTECRPRYNSHNDSRPYYQSPAAPVSRQEQAAREDEELELAMERSLAGTGRGRRSSIGTGRSFSMNNNPMGMHLPPEDEAMSSNNQQPFIWKKGSNNRYYKCSIDEHGKEFHAESVSYNDEQRREEQARLEQIEQDILEQAMEASIAEAKNKPGAINVAPPSYLNSPSRPSSGHRQRRNTAPVAYSTPHAPQTRTSPPDRAAIEQEERALRLAMEQSLRDEQLSFNRGNNNSYHHSPRRSSMPLQYPDGNWGSPSHDYPCDRRHDRNHNQQHRMYDHEQSPRRGSYHSSTSPGVRSTNSYSYGGRSFRGYDETLSVSSQPAVVWKKGKGGRYYKAPSDSLSDDDDDEQQHHHHYDPHASTASLPAMPGLETDRLDRMERDMMREAMERSIMDN